MASRRRPLPEEGRKRRIYDVLLPAAGVVALVGAGLDLGRFGGRPFYLVTLALFVAAAAVLFVAARLPAVRLEAVELGTLGVGAVGFTLVVWYDLYVHPFGATAGDAAFAMLMWLPVLHVLIFLAFDEDAAWRYAVAFLGLVVVLTLPHALRSGAAGGLMDRPSLLLQVILANALVVVALYFLAGFQGRLQRVEATAEAMRELANTDALTGIPNRRSAERTLERETRRAQRYERPLSVLLLDLDDFKGLNDSLGHPAGDQALVRLAERLRHMLRGSDSVARWGGEEFLIVAPETSLDDAARLAEAVREQVARRPLVGDARVGASVGVAGLRGGDDVASLVARADAALYCAKQGGKGRVCTEGQLGGQLGGEAGGRSGGDPGGESGGEPEADAPASV